MIEYKIDKDGTKEWFLDGYLHREDGPAVEFVNGNKMWFINGNKHREDGPAIDDVDGTKYWYINDIPHREDGPAVEHVDGEKSWYYNGKNIKCSSNEEFLKFVKMKSFRTKILWKVCMLILGHLQK